MKKLLVLAPHMDDENICAGSIAKLMENGYEVHCAAFTAAENSVPKPLPRDALAIDFEKSIKILGIKKSNVIKFSYEVREFSYVRQKILENMVVMSREIAPDLVFTTSSFDFHQDHKVIHDESIRAFRTSSILGYEVMWNNINFRADVFIPLEKRHIDKKLKIAKNYISQRARRKGDLNFFKDLAKVRGAMIGVKYAECFEAIRLIMK
jgi:LmbE family N-acetylglucosaminyl deacetylase